jgi:hypothetical protein
MLSFKKIINHDLNNVYHLILILVIVRECRPDDMGSGENRQAMITVRKRERFPGVMWIRQAAKGVFCRPRIKTDGTLPADFDGPR